MPDLNKLSEAILKGDAKAAEAIVKEAVAEKVDPEELVSKYMIPAMDEVGRRFECEEAFVPELLVAARAMKAALAIIDPLLKASGTHKTTKIVVGTVRGDLHDIGKNLVGSLLAGGGFEVIDLGVNVEPEKIIQAIREQGAQIVALSALLTTTMPAMKQTIDALTSAGLRDKVKVLVGGAPVTQAFADDIGADGYGSNATRAVELVRTLTATR